MSQTNNAHSRTQELRRKLHEAARARPSRRFHALYDKLQLWYVLAEAWRRVAENGGEPGVDGVTIAQVREQGVAEFLQGIAEELRAGTYRAQAVRRVMIPKPDGSQRPLGIPAVKDRVVQAAAKLVLEPIFEADFTEDSYGFRPGRGAVDALQATERELWQSEFALDADIEAYFDNVDHSKLKVLLRLRVSDRRMLVLIEQWLKCGYVDESGRHRTPKGTPQGGVLSPLLANVYLNYLDRQWRKRFQQLGKLVRYADDFVILCRTRMGATRAQQAVEEVMGKLGLRLHPQKTRVVQLLQGQEGLDFLGIHHRKVRQRRNPRAFRPTSWPSAKAMQKVRETIRQQVHATQRDSESYGSLLQDLNKYLGGWANYFKWSREASRRFCALDHFAKGQIWKWHMRRLGAKRNERTVQKVIQHLRSLPMWVKPNNWGRSRPKAAAW